MRICRDAPLSGRNISSNLQYARARARFLVRNGRKNHEEMPIRQALWQIALQMLFAQRPSIFMRFLHHVKPIVPGTPPFSGSTPASARKIVAKIGLFQRPNVQPTAVSLFKQAAFREGSILPVLSQNGAESDGGPVCRQRFLGQNLQADEVGVLAELFDRFAPVGFGGGQLFRLEDVADFAQGIGGISGAHEGYGREWDASFVVGLAAGAVRLAAGAGAKFLHGLDYTWIISRPSPIVINVSR